MNKTIEVILKSSPVIFGVLTVLGYIYLQSFYYFFDIDLINYLELSEIPLLFYNKSIIIITILLFVFIISYYKNYKLKKEEEDIKRKADTNEGLKNSNNDIQEADIYVKKIIKRLGLFLLFGLLYLMLKSIITGNYIGLIYPISYIILFGIFLLIEKNILKIIASKSNTNLYQQWFQI